MGEGDPKIGAAQLYRQEEKEINTLNNNLTNRKEKSWVQREEVGQDPTLSGPAMSSTAKQKSSRKHKDKTSICELSRLTR
ncbi:hypothetical protein CHS0354_019572 [Potamilus streckersoni]|uniref:Uncharacterized protein n=1 Tax=Potamilus streckersoni TaxID=2493646 RepID=A0AAE0TFR5_9BIVA|nr:hypothetical protein CHS0354_019572 [Potamilus streckersoni]